MTMTAEQRMTRSLRMKEVWQKKKAEAGEVPTDPAIREAMAKVPMNAVTAVTTTQTFTGTPLPGRIIEESQIESTQSALGSHHCS